MNIDKIFWGHRSNVSDDISAAILTLANVLENVGIKSDSLLSVKGAAQQLGITPQAIREMVTVGKLKSIRVGARGGRIKFKPSDIEAIGHSSKPIKLRDLLK